MYFHPASQNHDQHHDQPMNAEYAEYTVMKMQQNLPISASTLFNIEVRKVLALFLETEKKCIYIKIWGWYRRYLLNQIYSD